MPSSPDAERRLGFIEALGLRPFHKTAAETRLALRGDRYTPPSRFDHTSLRILRPALALQLWLGRAGGRRAPIYNLFNRTPTPEVEGWSVRKTQVRDYRGRELSYDSHNGTDFAVPPGTRIVAPAAGRVVLVTSEFQRGGKKLMLDHGDGLTTSYAHLGRVLVAEGDEVRRGEPIALSGASGLNFVGSLLADPPHLHFNVWLDGAPVDPFAVDGETPLWRDGNDPRPATTGLDELAPPSGFDADAVDAWIGECVDPIRRGWLRSIPELDRRAAATIFNANYYPTRFSRRHNPYRETHPRRPRLSLPLSAVDYDGVRYLDA